MCCCVCCCHEWELVQIYVWLIGSCLDVASPTRVGTLAAFTCSVSADVPCLLAGKACDNLSNDVSGKSGCDVMVG